MQVFDIIKGLRAQKADWEWGEVEKTYVPFIVNKALSMEMRSVLLANEMNKAIPPEWQYEFLRNALPKLNGRSTWVKQESDAQVDQLAEYYQCSLVKAREIADVLTPTQIAQLITEHSQTGGR